MKTKLLITGQNALLIDEMEKKLLDERYSLKKCSGYEIEIENNVENFEPDAIIIMLSHENASVLKVMNRVEFKSNIKRLPYVLVGKDEDIFEFKERLMHSGRIELVERPVEDDRLEEVMKTIRNDDDTEQTHSEEDGAESAEEKLSHEMSIEEALSKMSAENADLLKSLMKDWDGGQKNTSVNAPRKHILVVDDDTVMLNLIKSYLEDIYDVTIVTSGTQALRFLSRRKADLVLLDYILLDELGPNVLHKIRQEYSGAELPVIFLTGVSDKELVMSGMRQNPQDYILKPVAKDVLRERVAKQFKK